MLFLVVAILSLILGFPQPLQSIVTDSRWVIVAALAATLIPPAIAWRYSRRAVQLLDRFPDDPSYGQSAYARGMTLARFTLGGLHATLLLFTDWQTVCQHAPLVGGWLAVPGLLTALPFLVCVVLIWTVVYDADRAIRQIALEIYLFRQRPVHPVWTRWQFVTYNLRHEVLLILIPMIPILAVRDLVHWYHADLRRLSQVANIGDLLLGGCAAMIAVLIPLVLRYVWVTRPLPAGPLRDKLQHMSKKLRLRCGEILVWHSGGMIVNAAVIGVLAPLRYVLLTDAMIEQLEDTKIEAVFGHEAGHVKRHHITFFLLFALISGCTVTIFSVESRGLRPEQYQIASVLLGLLLAFKWGVLFFWISRKFERQADLYGAASLTIAGLPCHAPCAVHGKPGEPAPNPQPRHAVCATAAHVFGDTLHDVAKLNGISADVSNMRHGSIASRSRFLQKLAHDPAAMRRFEQQLGLIKLAIFVGAVGMSLWASVALDLWNVARRLLNW